MKEKPKSLCVLCCFMCTSILLLGLIFSLYVGQRQTVQQFIIFLMRKRSFVEATLGVVFPVPNLQVKELFKC